MNENIDLTKILKDCPKGSKLIDLSNKRFGKWTVLHKFDNPNVYIKDQGDLPDTPLEICKDVWIGSHVTLLKGSHIGRGAIIGSGAVVRTTIPPYAIVVGNPAKIVGFKFNPNEIIEHEAKLYPEDERIPKATIELNYEKYFLSRIKEINKYIKP